ncbi:Lipoprotein [Psychrobacter arenosus]
MINKSIKTIALSSLIISLMALASCVSAPTNENTMTDAQLVQLAKQTDRKPVEGEPNLVVGVHNGTKVIEEFHCSDLCPQNTVRIVHYDVASGPTCDAIGGVTKSILVPIAITVMPKAYCFPKVIADYWESSVQ